jgi:very-short-patch-repair endonuclease
MAEDAEGQRVAKARLEKVFQYLRALHQHRSPVVRQITEQLWHFWLQALPDHPSIRRARPPAAEAAGSADSRSDESSHSENAFVLKVRRPQLHRPPPPPESIADWLQPGWDDPRHTATIRESRNDRDAEGNTHVVRFGDASERVAALSNWLPRREEWAKNEQPALAAMSVFEQLYELHGQLEREGERVELVVGDGILSWRRPGGGILHPVLVQRVQLQFDPRVPEFTITETEHDVEFYTAAFQTMDDVDGEVIARCLEELRVGGFHPLDQEDTTGFLRSVVARLSPHGTFVETGRPRSESEHPVIGRDAVLFLRRRSLGFASAIDAVLEDLRTREELPGALTNIVGVEARPGLSAAGEAASVSTPVAIADDILLSKPANAEQVRIAQRLAAHGSVLVQGPPGTGKSHTIANLIGHLLAQGKTVVVTAETTKALRVLRDHVVEDLRPLCVSVLENDLDSRGQMEGAVSSIVERLSRADAAELEREAAHLAEQREQVLTGLSQAKRALLDARSAEYREIVIAGVGHAPAEAARRVAREQAQNSWIPSPVTPGAPLPLSEAEVTDLYRTNVAVSVADEAELDSQLPEPGSLPTPLEFRALVAERERLAETPRECRAEFWIDGDVAPPVEILEALALRLERAVRLLDAEQTWLLAVISAGRRGGTHREPWDRTVALISEIRAQAAAAQELLLRHQPQVSTTPSLEEQLTLVQEIRVHVAAGKGLGRFTLLTRPAWGRLLEAVRVASKRPSLPEHFEALHAYLSLALARHELIQRWKQQVSDAGGPSADEFGDQPEDLLEQFTATIRDALDWHAAQWEPLARELEGIKFRVEAFLNAQPPQLRRFGELIRLKTAVTGPLQAELAAKANTVRWRILESRLAEIANGLERMDADRGGTGVVGQLGRAVATLTPGAYEDGYRRLVDLHSRRVQLDRRRELLDRLEATAPAWASAIRRRLHPHAGASPPGNPGPAWLWRQLHDELEVRSSISLADLEDRIEQLGLELQRLTAALIDARAWAAQARRTTLVQRQALVGWLDTVRRIGKGFGRMVPKLRVAAAQRMAECRSAVPVWIMPLSRLVENFDPRLTRIDVLIIDEASQSDVMALLALYMAKEIVVVGDQEQVSPSAVGQRLDVVSNLIATHLQGIPNAILYDGRQSIYDLARQSFGATIRLLEHFRCVPEIIQFSNVLSYEGQIKPLRDPTTVALQPHVVAFKVAANAVDGKVNRVEVLAVASLLAALIEQPEYADKSLGVVSLVGDEQALAIERELRRVVPAEELRRRRLLCGNAAQFQGDERDVMFLTLVDLPENGPLPLREQEMFKQRFNVAASRAKDQMWVVHSLDPKVDLKPGDLRRRLIEHAEDPGVLLRRLEEGHRRVESELERLVFDRLLSAGYRVTAQWKVGYYRIDLVVEGSGRRLAIECDGDRYHPLEKLAEDMERQAVLERLGWRFARVRGSEFFRDPERAMRPVWAALERQGIAPQGPASDAASTRPVSLELRDRIIRRAEELRRAWQERSDGVDIRPEAASDRPPDPPRSANARPNPRVPETGVPKLSPITRDEARQLLVKLRDQTIRSSLPDSDRARGLLRKAVLQLVLEHLPTSLEEWSACIPDDQRQTIDQRQLHYLEDVFQITRRVRK